VKLPANLAQMTYWGEFSPVFVLENECDAIELEQIIANFDNLPQLYASASTVARTLNFIHKLRYP
jgi:hypothetical protein